MTIRNAARRSLKGLDLVLDGLALFGLVVMVLIISWQVFARFVLDDSPRWASETALVLMGWLGFLGVAIGLREGSNIAVGFITERLPRTAQRVAGKLTPLPVLGSSHLRISRGNASGCNRVR